MRFPLRDVIPSRTRPWLTLATLVVATTAVAFTHPDRLAFLVLAVSTVPLLVLGETVEDQLGRARHAGLLLVTAGLGLFISGTPLAVLAAVTAGIAGIHLSLFPTARILVSLGITVVEVPSFFLAGCWVLTLVVLRIPLSAAAIALLGAAALARLVRPRDRARWEHFDRAG